MRECYRHGNHFIEALRMSESILRCLQTRKLPWQF
ncbi:MAG: hypothetical protein DMF02_03045 [Verrucomicrobia bacterium]|nr:MAG: hypothetical protein DMF02_03045 [Verrucomicrobiota bacterium]